jgi:hypothetical protein
VSYVSSDTIPRPMHSRCENPEDEHEYDVFQIPVEQLSQAMAGLNNEIADRVSSSSVSATDRIAKLFAKFPSMPRLS